MPRYIKPFSAPNTRVAPMREEEFGFANSTPGEKALLDSIAFEHVRYGGTPIEFYALDKTKSSFDFVYGESVNKFWVGPYHVIGHVDWPDPTPEMREEGYRNSFTTVAWITRLEFENQKIQFPNRGDVIRFWKIPIFESLGVDEQKIPNAGYFFNVVNAADDGHMFDNPDFTGFRLELRRYSEFTPERRVLPP